MVTSQFCLFLHDFFPNFPPKLDFANHTILVSSYFLGLLKRFYNYFLTSTDAPFYPFVGHLFLIFDFFNYLNYFLF